MKKIICLLFIILLSFGCSDKESVKKETELKETTMKSYAKKIFDNEMWMNGGVKEGTYSVSVKDMKEKMGYDVSIFEKSKCNLEETKVEFIVKKQEVNEKTNYEYNYVYSCEK